MKPLLKPHPDASNEPLASGVRFDSNAAILARAALFATPLNAQTASVTDIDVLNYALTLERLEASFYTEGLKRFTSSDFAGGTLDTNLGNPHDRRLPTGDSPFPNAFDPTKTMADITIEVAGFITACPA